MCRLLTNPNLVHWPVVSIVHWAPRKDQELSIDLITDGGPENVNCPVDAFLREEALRMRCKVALEDIAISNSMVEATN